jgi:energy-coupling factor transport system ATP-binding protein
MSETVIHLKDFYYAYPKSELMLQDINLSIEKGSFTAIAGPSGAGKTTLCRAMTGIVPYYYGGRYAGTVEVLGEDIKGKKISDLAMHVGIMLDDYESQMVSLTAGEEISFSLLNHGFSPDEVDARVSQALNDVGLPDRENYQLDELSGGQRQRLLLASVLATRPEVLILDEPVSAMDPDGARSLYELVNRIHRTHDMTVVVVEHDLNYLLPYMTHLILMEEGKIAISGPYEEAARQAFAHPTLCSNLPELWQVKLGLERTYGVTLGNWRDEEEALEELQEKFRGGGQA